MIAGLVSLLGGTAQGQTRNDISPEERETVVAAISAALEKSYVFAETAAKMAESLRAGMATKDYHSFTNGRDFARKLTADLREVSRDRHLSVSFFPDGAPDLDPDNLTPDQKAAHAEFLRKINFGFEKFERMEGNIGYLDLRGFVPPDLGGDTATAAMTLLAHTDALIIDLRRNRGGEPAMIAYLTSYLFDQPTHLNDIHERAGNKTQQWWTMPHVPGRRFGGQKPIYLLTSKDTFSGGEEFAYNLQNLKRATVIGDTTKGGAHPSRPVKVSGRFVVELPYARAINPITQTNWEGTGVRPDIAKPEAEALDTAYELALKRVWETTTNQRQREQLQKLLEKRAAQP